MVPGVTDVGVENKKLILEYSLELGLGGRFGDDLT